MRIGVTYEDGNIFQHFGHTEQFKLYDVENEKIKSTQIVGTNGHGHGALASFLTKADVKVLICGGIGAGAQNALAEAGIRLYGGVTGNADEAVNNYITGNLDYNQTFTVCIMNMSIPVGNIIVVRINMDVPAIARIARQR